MDLLPYEIIWTQFEIYYSVDLLCLSDFRLHDFCKFYDQFHTSKVDSYSALRF